jgi:hypothetical protein
MIPTSGAADKTVCTFFINNSRRYLAWGAGLYHVPIPNEDYFNAIKDVLQKHDIPTQEIGDQDTRVYGIELAGREEIRAEIPALVGSTPVHDLVDNQTHTLAEMIGFIDLNANHAAGPRAKLVRAKDDPTGAIYVVTDTTFRHITGAALEAGAALGLWGGFPDTVTLDPEHVAALAEHLGGKLYVAPAAG